MNIKYKIVIATELNQQEFLEKSAIAISLDKFGMTGTADIVYENKEGLSKLYNKYITEENRGYKIIFVHDDVIIEDIFLFEKLDLAFEKFDVVGLAGAKQCNINAEVPAWHMMAPQERYVGEVSHSHQGRQWTTVFGETPSRALVIDGLFIAVNVDRLLDTNTKFVEDFTFHHYDIAFCLKANENAIKIGVYPIKVVHFGLGDSMNTIEWKNSADTFKKIFINGDKK